MLGLDRTEERGEEDTHCCLLDWVGGWVGGLGGWVGGWVVEDEAV